MLVENSSNPRSLPYVISHSYVHILHQAYSMSFFNRYTLHDHFRKSNFYSYHYYVTFQMSVEGNFDDDFDRFRPDLGKAEWAVLQNIFSSGRSGKKFKHYLQGFTPYMPNEVRKRVKQSVLEIRKSGIVSSYVKSQLSELCSNKTLKELKLYDIVRGNSNSTVSDNIQPTLGWNDSHQVPSSFSTNEDFVPFRDDCQATSCSEIAQATSSDLSQGSGIPTFQHQGEIF